MHIAPAHLGVERLGVGEAWRCDDPLQAVRDDRRVERRALGAVAEELAPQARDPLGRRAPSPPPPARPASRGSAAPRTARPARPRAAWPAPGARRTARAAPSPCRAVPPRAGAGVQLGEAERPLGDARADALHELADAPADAAQVLAPVGAAPDLEPVDDQREAHRAARSSAAASSEKYGKAHVWTTS